VGKSWLSADSSALARHKASHRAPASRLFTPHPYPIPHIPYPIPQGAEPIAFAWESSFPTLSAYPNSHFYFTNSSLGMKHALPTSTTPVWVVWPFTAPWPQAVYSYAVRSQWASCLSASTVPSTREILVNVCGVYCRCWSWPVGLKWLSKSLLHSY
jgi:hypothetical protein